MVRMGVRKSAWQSTVRYMLDLLVPLIHSSPYPDHYQSMSTHVVAALRVEYTRVGMCIVQCYALLYLHTCTWSIPKGASPSLSTTEDPMM